MIVVAEPPLSRFSYHNHEKLARPGTARPSSAPWHSGSLPDD
jgi:hypothetical protein